MHTLCNTSLKRGLLASSILSAMALGVSAMPAMAADLAAPPPVVTAPAFFTTDWTSTITHSFQLEAGIAVNPDSPGNHNNFGQEFTDKPNEVQPNQALLTFARPVDATKTYDIGFNFQALFGSDARYDPTIGILDYTMTGRTQFVFTQLNVVLHSPGITSGGIDTKIGLIPGAMGYETTDPSTRPFYTLSYITNYLLAFETVGALSTWHINPTIDVYTGIDAGNETTPWRDNNRSPAGYVGFGLNNLLDNKLTVLAISRFGPEDPQKFFPGQDVNTFMRYWNDVTLTYKATDKWTFVGEGNYFRDEVPGAPLTAFGFAGYASYAYNDEYTLNTRAEVYRDNTGGITTGWLSNTAFTSTIAGNPDQYYFAPPTTYGAITAGITIKPTWLNTIQSIGKFTIRPEIRYDRSLNGTRPFDVQAAGVGTKRDQVLISSDVIFAF